MISSVPVTGRVPARPNLSAAVHEAEVVERAATPMRTKFFTLTLMPGKGLEFKAAMTTGRSIDFEWSGEGSPTPPTCTGRLLHRCGH